ncbi:helix-turn-helix transcriptional regulator [Maritalea porphyrae]|uniref:helix-turn-helix transcriptional regulator n=1 Tax=Maritalea porphyrae TaxID=880732 RepID=UPI0022AEEB81|nr:helix-turn-helix transcriptional regulator [Maritalea porphyrae]MCZ4271048.1 helix-turn-helix transcriptional regulator [Maritalea porphyrae]
MKFEAPLTIHQFSQVTEVLFQAALDSSKWQEFIAALSKHTGDLKTHMFGYDTHSNLTLNMIGHGYSEEAIDIYLKHFYKENAWAPGFARANEGEVVHSQDMIRLEALERTEFYNDWVKPQEDVCAGGGVMLFKSGSRTIMLGGNIRRKDTEKLEAKWLNALRILQPHIRHAFEFNRIVADQSLSDIGITGPSLGPHKSAIFIIDENANLGYANTKGEQLLNGGGPVRWSMSSRFRFNAIDLNIALCCALDSMRRRDHNISQHQTSFDPTIGGFEMRIMRISPSNPLLPFPFTLNSPHLLVALSPLRSEAQNDAVLRHKHHLSAAEVSVVCAFCAGSTLREISDGRRVSIYTVRNQIKSAMSKLGVKSQLQLVCKLRDL